MNAARVVLAGLAAGLVANILDVAINVFLVAEEMAANLQRLGLREGPESMYVWIAVDFIYGLLIAFTYAAIRPRFGPGPKTAIIAGSVLFAAITVVLTGFMAMGMFMQDVFIKSAALSYLSTLAASLVAGRLYRE
jgi:hypothetical protein